MTHCVCLRFVFVFVLTILTFLLLIRVLLYDFHNK